MLLEPTKAVQCSAQIWTFEIQCTKSILPFGLGTYLGAGVSLEVPGDDGEDDNDDGLS